MRKHNTRFSIMIAGSTDSGKTSFFNSLVDKEVIPKTNSEEINIYLLNLEYDGNLHKITLIDTPGFGNSMNDTPLINSIVNYIKDQFDSYIEEETKIRRNPKYEDTRVHCLLYMIPATGNGLKKRDIDFLKKVANLVNIIPVITKTEGLLESELFELRYLIKQQLEQYKICIFDFENEETIPQVLVDLRLNSKIPFSCVFPLKLEEEIRSRYHPNGVVEIDNPVCNDFSVLKDALLNSHTDALVEITSNDLYEKYRSETLENILQD